MQCVPIYERRDIALPREKLGLGPGGRDVTASVCDGKDTRPEVNTNVIVRRYKK